MSKTSKATSLIIGYTESDDMKGTVLVVGRKTPKKDAEVINAFQGEEAYWMYQKLVTKKEKKNVAVEEIERKVERA